MPNPITRKEFHSAIRQQYRLPRKAGISNATGAILIAIIAERQHSPVWLKLPPQVRENAAGDAQIRLLEAIGKRQIPSSDEGALKYAVTIIENARRDAVKADMRNMMQTRSAAMLAGDNSYLEMTKDAAEEYEREQQKSREMVRISRARAKARKPKQRKCRTKRHRDKAI